MTPDEVKALEQLTESQFRVYVASQLHEINERLGTERPNGWYQRYRPELLGGSGLLTAAGVLGAVFLGP